MASLNKVIIIGNLGKDPDIKYTQNGTAVANFSVATTFKPKDGDEKTEWHRIVAWDRLAEIIGEWVKKGSQIYIEGRLQTRSWEKDGVTRYTTEIIAERMLMLGGKGESSGMTVTKETGFEQVPPNQDDESDIPF